MVWASIALITTLIAGGGANSGAGTATPIDVPPPDRKAAALSGVQPHDERASRRAKAPQEVSTICLDAPMSEVQECDMMDGICVTSAETCWYVSTDIEYAALQAFR